MHHVDDMGATLRAARSITGWESRRSALLISLEEGLGVPRGDLDESYDWNALAVASYLAGPPYSYYFEPSFTEYQGFLAERYGSDPALLGNDLSSCGHDLFAAVELVEGIAQEAFDLPEDIDAYEKVQCYLNPWYLRLVEQGFDSLLALPAFRLQDDVGKQLGSSPWNIFEAITKHGWTWAGSFYNAGVRRGIAHEVRFHDPGGRQPIEVIYTDDRGNSEQMIVDEVEGLVLGLVDQCLAYSFALRLFLLENRNAPDLVSWMQPEVEPFAARARRFPLVAGSSYLRVESIHREIVNEQTQVRIECLDKTTHDQERMCEVLSVLVSVAAWFPEAETYFLGAKGSDRWSSGLRISRGDLLAWINGQIEDEQLANVFDPYLMWPIKKRFGRIRAKWTRVARAALSEYRRVRVQAAAGGSTPFRMISLQDISTGLARRYRCELETAVVSHNEVREALPAAVKGIRGRRTHSSDKSRKRWVGASPHYVTGWIYSREKRERDRWADETAQFFVGSFEWRDPDADPDNLPLEINGANVEALGDGLVYEPNLSWPPSDIHVPRAAIDA